MKNLIRKNCLLALALMVGAASVSARADEKAPVTSRSNLRIALYADEGSKKGGDAVETCLLKGSLNLYKCTRVTAEEIRNGVLKDFDVIVCGGGSGSKIGNTLEEEGREQIRSFIRNGGGYIGICAGAYLATSDYTWSLHVLNAKVIDRQHWARGGGKVILTMSEEGQKTLGTPAEVECRYNQGPLLGPDTKPDLPAYTPLATYKTEINKDNKAPPGIMIGTTAIARAEYGQGRVMAISPHPESTAGLDGIIRAAMNWVGKIENPVASAR